MNYIEPQAAQIGDVVVDMCGSGRMQGRVVGIDTQAPGILVRWDDEGLHPMDVYSLDSPVWSVFAIERLAPVPNETTVAALNEAELMSALNVDPPGVLEQSGIPVPSTLPWSTEQ